MSSVCTSRWFLLCFFEVCDLAHLLFSPPCYFLHRRADLSAWGWTTPGVAWAGLSATGSGYKNLSTAVDAVNTAGAQNCGSPAVYTRASVLQCAADASGCYVNDVPYAVRNVFE